MSKHFTHKFLILVNFTLKMFRCNVLFPHTTNTHRVITNEVSGYII